MCHRVAAFLDGYRPDFRGTTRTRIARTQADCDDDLFCPPTRVAGSSLSVSEIPFRVHCAVNTLRISGKARVIEVGCGTGHALAALRVRYPKITLTGIDRSATQIAKARRLLNTLPPGMRPALAQLTLTAASKRWHATPFDWLLAINVNAFWTEPSAAFAAARELLRPRGKALLVYEPPAAAGLEVLSKKLRLAIDASSWRVVDERRRASCILFTVQSFVPSVRRA